MRPAAILRGYETAIGILTVLNYMQVLLSTMADVSNRMSFERIFMILTLK